MDFLTKTYTKFKDSKGKNIILDIGVIVLGAALAFGVFGIIKSVEGRKERNNIIPSAQAAYEGKEYSKAINLFQNAEKVFPENQDVKKNLANLYFLKGKYDEALNYYQTLPATSLTDKDYENIGQIYFEKNDLEKVIENWKNRSISPQNTYKLAKIYYEKENFDFYYSELEKIQEYKEPVLLLQIRKGNDLQGIIDGIDKAATLPNVSNETINFPLFKNQIVDSKKQLENKKKEYSDLIQLAAFGNINQCRILFPRFDELKKNFQTKNIPVYQVDYYKGYCLNQVEKADEAIPLIQAAIKADPGFVEYKESLAKSYFLKKDVENLKKTYSEILQKQKTSVHYENLAIYLYKLGNYDEALTSYDAALANTQSKEEQKKYAKTIFEIQLLNKKNLEVCRRSELLNVLDINNSEQNLILGQCKLFVSQNLEGVKDTSDLNYEYLNALKSKNQDSVNVVLDKDIDGLITTYYKAVGEQLLS